MTILAPKINIKGACVYDEPLQRHTTLGIGGKIPMWVEPSDIDELKSVLKEINSGGVSWRTIGNGSNILAGENGLPEVVINLKNFSKLSVFNETFITAESGVNLAKLVNFAEKNDLSGLEFLSGIPGTVGGAIKGNAGAHGKNISSILKEVLLMNKRGELFNLPGEKINFGYRYSDIGNDVIILAGVFRLTKGIQKNLIAEYLQNRKEMFPVEPNAGCIFKNPHDMSAGRIIDRLGLKGFSIGMAMISHKHGNIIVNLGSATVKDMHSLIKYIRHEVLTKTGIDLELEIDCWGE